MLKLAILLTGSLFLFANSNAEIIAESDSGATSQAAVSTDPLNLNLSKPVTYTSSAIIGSNSVGWSNGRCYILGPSIRPMPAKWLPAIDQFCGPRLFVLSPDGICHMYNGAGIHKSYVSAIACSSNKFSRDAEGKCMQSILPPNNYSDAPIGLKIPAASSQCP